MSLAVWFSTAHDVAEAPRSGSITKGKGVTRILFAILAGVFGCHIWAVPSAAEPSCDKSFAQVFREISPSVVRVFSVSIDPFSLRERVQLGIGSGLVIDDHGHIVTNAHVVHGASVVMVGRGSGEGSTTRRLCWLPDREGEPPPS